MKLTPTSNTLTIYPAKRHVSRISADRAGTREGSVSPPCALSSPRARHARVGAVVPRLWFGHPSASRLPSVPSGWTVYVAAVCRRGDRRRPRGGGYGRAVDSRPGRRARSRSASHRDRGGGKASAPAARGHGRRRGSELRTSLVTPRHRLRLPRMRHTTSRPLPSPSLLSPPLLPQPSSRRPACRRATDEQDAPSEPAVAPPITDSRPLDEDDWHGLARICGAISSAQLVWMRVDTFSTPWLDEHVRPFVDLEPVAVALRERPFSDRAANSAGHLRRRPERLRRVLQRQHVPGSAALRRRTGASSIGASSPTQPRVRPPTTCGVLVPRTCRASRWLWPMHTRCSETPR